MTEACGQCGAHLHPWECEWASRPGGVGLIDVRCPECRRWTRLRFDRTDWVRWATSGFLGYYVGESEVRDVVAVAEEHR